MGNADWERDEWLRFPVDFPDHGNFQGRAVRTRLAPPPPYKAAFLLINQIQHNKKLNLAK